MSACHAVLNTGETGGGGAESLRWKFVQCILSTLINLAGGQVLRLVSNMILTRMLFPEAFGLMALVNLFLMGLAMFSDIGIGPGIVQRKGALTPAFLQTAWTVQVLRAGALFLITCLLAWPLSVFYDQPELLLVLPVTGLTQLISGFKSVALHTYSRDLRHGTLAVYDLSTGLVGLSSSILFAWMVPSVWALVWGGMVSAVYAVIFSFRLPHQSPLRLRLDPAHASELFRFGAWIFLGTALTFVASSGDRLMLGKFLSLQELGVYTVAFFFAQSVSTLIRGLAARVLFPVLAKLRQDGLDRGAEYIRYRRGLLGLTIVGVGFLMLGSGWMIELLYDDRYLPAGGMLRVLSLGAAATSLVGLADPVLLSNGNSKRRMWLSFYEAAFLLLCMGVGGACFGLHGYIWGYVCAQFLSYVPAVLLVKPYKVATPLTDGMFLGAVLLLWILSGSINPSLF
jgi:O-antigen/teichoic acid export membrane protein